MVRTTGLADLVRLKWLPFSRLWTQPAFSNAFAASAPEQTGSLAIDDKLNFGDLYRANFGWQPLGFSRFQVQLDSFADVF